VLVRGWLCGLQGSRIVGGGAQNAPGSEFEKVCAGAAAPGGTWCPVVAVRIDLSYRRFRPGQGPEVARESRNPAGDWGLCGSRFPPSARMTVGEVPFGRLCPQRLQLGRCVDPVGSGYRLGSPGMGGGRGRFVEDEVQPGGRITSPSGWSNIRCRSSSGISYFSEC